MFANNFLVPIKVRRVNLARFGPSACPSARPCLYRAPHKPRPMAIATILLLYIDCHQTLSVIPLATGGEVIKFRKIKIGVGGMRSTERP